MGAVPLTEVHRRVMFRVTENRRGAMAAWERGLEVQGRWVGLIGLGGQELGGEDRVLSVEPHFPFLVYSEHAAPSGLRFWCTAWPSLFAAVQRSEYNCRSQWYQDRC